MKQSHKTLILWIVLIGFLIAIAQMITSTPTKGDKISYDEFVKNIEANEISSVTIKDNEYNGTYKNDKKFYFTGPEELNKDNLKLLVTQKVKIEYEKKEEGSLWQSMLISWLPMILIFFLFFFFIRQLQGGGGKAMSFGKSKAKLITDGVKVTFEDVAGIDESKEELEEVVDFLKNPQKYTKLGGKIPKGVLLTGPPGTGKTLLAKAVAGEAKVPFFSISGSDFVEMFVGVGASRVRDLFEQGKKNSPCIIFIDEIDAVGRQRGAGLGGGHDEREQTLNQLLVEMDGFEGNDGIILIAATNRPDVLDPALLRPGRFDRQIIVPRPDVKGRKKILEIHSKKKPISKGVDLEIIARGTTGFTGADLANLLNEGALLAARDNQEEITIDNLEKAKDKVLMGVERKSMIIPEKEKFNTAFHESGHALMAKELEGEDSDHIHKVTIIPRGRALGVTIQLPKEDRLSATINWCNNRIKILMSGRIAEELSTDNNFTSGASNDFKVATNLAKSMVTEWGMSDLPLISYSSNDQEIFLGREVTKHQNLSDKTVTKIDHEIEKIITRNYNFAKAFLTENYDKLLIMSQVLMVKETIELDIINRIYQGESTEQITGSNDALKWTPEFFNNKTLKKKKNNE